jgi:hypothetical protein
MGEWVGPGASTDVLKKRKIFWPSEKTPKVETMGISASSIKSNIIQPA